MDGMARAALGLRLERADAELQRALHALDGSLSAWTALHRARLEYREAEALALAVLGARDALAIVETHTADAYEATEAEGLLCGRVRVQVAERLKQSPL